MTGDDGGKEGGKEGGQQEGGAKQGRSKNMTFPELMCCMWAALGTNERFSAGAATALRLSTFNSDYKQRVKWMQEPREELVAEVHQDGFRNLEAGLERRIWLPGS